MCRRLFLSTQAPLLTSEAGSAFDGPDLRLRPPGAHAAPVVARLSGYVVEVGAYDGCACGFGAEGVAWSAQTDRREVVLPMIDALDALERRELTSTLRSLDALARVVRAGAADGPVQLYSCWWGNEEDTVIDTRALDLGELSASIDPIPDRVLLTVG